MSFKNFLADWTKFLLAIIGLVIVPILTAIPVATSYDIPPSRVYVYFAIFYVLSFVIVGTPHWIRYISRKETYKILKEEKLIRKMEKE